MLCSPTPPAVVHQDKVGWARYKVTKARDNNTILDIFNAGLVRASRVDTDNTLWVLS